MDDGPLTIDSRNHDLSPIGAYRPNATRHLPSDLLSLHL